MQAPEADTSWVERPQEEERLSALASTGILDTDAESSFDAVTRLCAEYFKADTVLLGFADATRFWIKSSWGEAVRELPQHGTRPVAHAGEHGGDGGQHAGTAQPS